MSLVLRTAVVIYGSCYIHYGSISTINALHCVFISQQGRGGKGSIFVWAAGNGGTKHDSCAADGYVNSIYTIAIGSASSDGSPAYYDEMCSAKMAATFVNNPNAQSPHVVRTIS